MSRDSACKCGKGPSPLKKVEQASTDLAIAKEALSDAMIIADFHGESLPAIATSARVTPFMVQNLLSNHTATAVHPSPHKGERRNRQGGEIEKRGCNSSRVVIVDAKKPRECQCNA